MNKADYKNYWVYIEHDGRTVQPVSLELCCEARKLCDQNGEALVAVIAGELPRAEVDRIRDCGVDGILYVSGTGYDRYNTEAYTNLFTRLCAKYKPSAVLIGATVNGRDFAPRFAADLETGCTSDATELIYNPDTGDIEFVEPAAGGKIMAVITIPVLRPQVGTLRPGTFKHVPAGRKARIDETFEKLSFPAEKIRTNLISFVPDAMDEALDIAGEDTIVCIGNGVKDGSVGKYRELAGLLGGKLAGTRPVIDRELLSPKLQVGQSGVMIRPKLYIGFGISGAVNHVIGVDADCFVAVNSDPEATIFNYCDYGIAGDMDEVCEALIMKLRAAKQ